MDLFVTESTALACALPASCQRAKSEASAAGHFGLRLDLASERNALRLRTAAPHAFQFAMQFRPKHTQAPMPAKRKRGMGFGTAGALERAVRGYLERAAPTAGPKWKPFELWEYRKLQFGATPHGPSLASLNPLLLALLAVAPSAIVNQKALESALLAVNECEKEMQLVPPTMTDALWAGWLAAQLRTALSHCRRLKLNLRLRRQVRARVEEAKKAAFDETVDAVVVEDAVGAELEADEAENSGQLALATAEVAPESERKRTRVRRKMSSPPRPLCENELQRCEKGTALQECEKETAGEPAAAHCTPPRRRLCRKESAGSQVSVDFDALLGSPADVPVRVTPAQCGLLMNLLSSAPRPAGQGAQGAQVTAAVIAKKPATATARGKKAATGRSVKASAAVASADFNVMWYKTSNAVAVRERNGKQLFQVACKGAARQELEALARQCVERLVAGATAQSVKAWAEKQKLELARASSGRGEEPHSSEGEEEEKVEEDCEVEEEPPSKQRGASSSWSNRIEDYEDIW